MSDWIKQTVWKKQQLRETIISQTCSLYHCTSHGKLWKVLACQTRRSCVLSLNVRAHVACRFSEMSSSKHWGVNCVTSDKQKNTRCVHSYRNESAVKHREHKHYVSKVKMAEVSWEPFDREWGVFEVCMKGVPLKSMWSDNCMKGAPLKIMWSANQFIFIRRHGWRIARGEL